MFKLFGKKREKLGFIDQLELYTEKGMLKGDEALKYIIELLRYNQDKVSRLYEGVVKKMLEFINKYEDAVKNDNRRRQKLYKKYLLDFIEYGYSIGGCIEGGLTNIIHGLKNFMKKANNQEIKKLYEKLEESGIDKHVLDTIFTLYYIKDDMKEINNSLNDDKEFSDKLKSLKEKLKEIKEKKYKFDKDVLLITIISSLGIGLWLTQNTITITENSIVVSSFINIGYLILLSLITFISLFMFFKQKKQK